jgi:hypothetical protein
MWRSNLSIMDPLRAEHRELLPPIESPRTTAASVGQVPADRLLGQVQSAYEPAGAASVMDEEQMDPPR